MIKHSSDTEEFYKKIRNSVFEEITPAEILREKQENPEQVKAKIRNICLQTIQISKRVLPIEYQEQIIHRLLNEIFGFGMIQPLLEDPSVSEIMINAPDEVYIERDGKLLKSDVQFESPGQIMQIIDRIVSPLGRRIDESSPLVDARLPDGSRVNAIIPPIAVKSPTLTIRKFKDTILDYDSLITFGSMTREMADFIHAIVRSRANIIISGGTGSGKTTLLNVCSTSIPAAERIITVEDSVELKLKQPHVISLEARPPNIEGQGQVTIRDLVINCLRMRPDRILVGEVRGKEAFDMLQAMNTGHDGSLTTVHANTPKDVISRLTSMVYMTGLEMPVHILQEMIYSAIECVIQTARFSDGSRRITTISELAEFQDKQVVLNPIYQFVIDGRDENGKIQGHYEYKQYTNRIKSKLEALRYDKEKPLDSLESKMNSNPVTNDPSYEKMQKVLQKLGHTHEKK
ncbi:MAG: CpaF family protein [Caldisericia bacterium]|nr:CpaF family protein [Caldisericia bacterium]MDD4614620.1 CpaF family protein [Caldisericia bacterium]